MAKTSKKLAKKYISRPEDYPNHKYFDLEKMAATLNNAGMSVEDIHTTLKQYIEGERDKCMADPVYFANNFGFIIGHGSAGVMPMTCAEYQDTLLNTVRNNKYSICVKSRQLGVSTIMVFYALWFSIFSTGKRTLIVAHNREAAQEFITKVKTAYEFLPEWMKPACVLYSKDTIEFDTKSKIKAITSNPHAARSFSATLFVLDEAGFIDGAHEVVKGLLPTIAAGDGKLIALSSPNGNSDENWFYNTCIQAKNKTNGWAYHEFPWTVSPVFCKNPNFRADQIRIDNGNVDKFTQEYECFEGTACVSTPFGLTEIKNLNPGDHVISHSGRIRKVLTTMNKDYCGDLVEIFSTGSHEPIRCTPEHPIQVYKRETQEYFWKSAKDIHTEDWVVFPKLNTKTIISILSEELVKIIAWYITEGSCGYGYVKFSLSNELTEVNHVSSILTALTIKHSKTHGPTGWQIQVNNANFSDFLKSNCGSGAEYKHIPFPLISGHETVFFNELILGDGNYSNGIYQYDTISKALAYQIQMLAHSLADRNYLATIRLTPSHQSIIEGRVVNCNDSYHLRITEAHKRNREIKLHRTKCSIAMKVHTINIVPYSGKVYNLSVQYDESYIVAGRAVHNCNFDVNLASLFNKEALKAFIPSDEILNKQFGGITYDDTFWIWKIAEEGKQYIIGVDCSANKSSSRDFSAFQVLDRDTQEQVAEYMGRLDTEILADILIKTANHYNKAEIVFEENSFSEMLVYLVENRGYTNFWFQDDKPRPGFNTNRHNRVLLIEKLVLFYNNKLGMSQLKSRRLKVQLENFSQKTLLQDGTRKIEAVKGNDDLALALALALIPLTPKYQMHRPSSEMGIAIDGKDFGHGDDYSEEYIEYWAEKMGISQSSLAHRLRLYHDIKQGKYDGSGVEEVELKHPVEEFEKAQNVADFLGTVPGQIISDTEISMITISRAVIPTRDSYVIDDIFEDSWIQVQRAHRNFISGVSRSTGSWMF